MQTFARIESGHVAELFATAGDITTLFHPSIKWVPAPAEAAVGWTYSVGQFAAPVTPAPVTVIPSSVSPAQARLALLAAGKLAQVEAIVAAADPATRIAWDNATYIERSSPTVAALSAALGLNSTQLDALFTAAAAIRV